MKISNSDIEEIKSDSLNSDENTEPLNGWKKHVTSYSLPEVYSTINVPSQGSFWKKLLAYTGPGLMVAVGYMDPGTGLRILQVAPDSDIYSSV